MYTAVRYVSLQIIVDEYYGGFLIGLTYMNNSLNLNSNKINKIAMYTYN